MYLLEGCPAPDHATFARFRTLHFAPCAQGLLAEMTEFLHRTGEISGETIFIDGTKIEACANKYTYGNENVLAEITLPAMAHNIRKLHRKIQGNRTGIHLFPLKKRQPCFEIAAVRM